MSLPDGISAGDPCWVDLSTSDPDAARIFYAALFGWTADEPAGEFGGYLNFRLGDRLVAGCMPSQGSTAGPDAWGVHLAVSDAEAAADAAVAHGATLLAPPMAVGDLGVLAVLADPGGAVVGLWQAGRHEGFRITGDPGTAVWFELLTRDHAGSVAFYRDVLGWAPFVVGDTDEFRYTTHGEGAEATAGMMDAAGWLPEGVPAHWSVYFSVEDADHTAAEAQRLGGAVAEQPTDTPYGRMGTLTDPTGARFKVLQQR